ncbi:hypothetical protein ACHAQJ_008284 [Trichoderma viride]
MTESVEGEAERDLDSLNSDTIAEQLASELRNPSDALHILTQSEKSGSTRSSALPSEEERDALVGGPPIAVSLDEYDMIQKGLVHRNNISDLLHLTSWSLVGLAVRQAYLMRLDQGAFPNISMQETKEEADQKRLIWTYVYIADRQISVRLGQSFWSRGPSLSTRFTAKDFPSLQPTFNGGQDDYASVHQATMELTQLMHNVQAILYASPKRTLAMVHDGDYSRYLDDFQRAAINWHAFWSDLAVSLRVKRSLSLVYEYLCLYVNAFSFQAVLTRLSISPRTSTPNALLRSSAKPFSKGIMKSPDGRYVWDAITAATNTLKLMTDFDPQELCYLPYRYHL